MSFRDRVRRSATGLCRPAIVGSAALLAAASALGEPWNVEPSVSLSASYQSNPQFYSDEARSGSGEIVTLALPTSWEDGRTRFQFRPTGNAGRSAGAAGLGVDNRTADLSWRRAFGQGEWRASGGYSRVDLFGREAADLGLLRPTGYLTSTVASAGTTLRPTERGALDLDLSQRRLAYHDTAAEFIDYRYSVLAAQYAYALTERTQLLSSISDGQFRPDGTRPASHDVSVQIGASRQFTETLFAQVTAGSSRTRRDGSVTADQGSVYAATLRKTLLTGSVTVGTSRSRQPGAYGDLALLTSYNLGWTQQYSARLAIGAAAGEIDSEDSFAGLAVQRHGYRYGELTLNYQLTRAWRVDLKATMARSSSPTALPRTTAVAASSTGGSIGLVRVFGPTRLF